MPETPKRIKKIIDSAADRIIRWIETKKHIFKTDYVRIEVSGSIIGTEQMHDILVEIESSASSEYTVKTTLNSSQTDLAKEPINLNANPKRIELLVG